MGRITASRIIAFVKCFASCCALVVNRKSVGYIPSNPVRQDCFCFNRENSSTACYIKNAVTIFVNACHPIPAWSKFRAMVWDWSIFVNFKPESFLNRFSVSFAGLTTKWFRSVFNSVWHNNKSLAACRALRWCSVPDFIVDCSSLGGYVINRFDVVAHIVFSEADPYRGSVFALRDYSILPNGQ